MHESQLTPPLTSEKPRERKIIVLNFLQTQEVKEEIVTQGALQFTIREHSIGWDFETAELLIQNYDGYVDGFALSGIQKHLGVPGEQAHHPAYLRLIRAAIKTPIYVADDLREFFSDWSLKRILQEQPQIFFQKKVLFQCAMASSLLSPVVEAGGEILAADPLLLSGTPVLLKGVTALKALYKVSKPFADAVIFNLVKPSAYGRKDRISRPLKKWMGLCDIFVGFGTMMDRIRSFEPLAGKIVIVDHIDEKTRERLESAGVAQIIEFIPSSAVSELPSSQHFPVLAAMIDQTRIFEKSSLSFSEYLLKWIEKTKVSPKPLKSAKGIRRKCAFIFHPLSQSDLWRQPQLQLLKNSPSKVRSAVERMASFYPCFKIGKLTGVVSEATGQEVECDFYAIAATPKEILGMKEEFLYKRLVQCADMARRDGAGMIGLGAYTKVAGDAGVTVSKRASIPVTNGNSYSASTTLWAARQMVEKLGLISPERVGNRFKAKAMIIGATGSIGRVSSLLVSLVFQEVILVANRPDKLLELREEILRLSPGIRVSVTTQANSEISDADLIVTATSNQHGSILDIYLVKPGAVICDCSRPLDIGPEEAKRRPDVLVIESGEVILPGNPQMTVDIGLPYPSVYACTAETVLLALEGRFESFSLSKQLSLEKVKEIYKLGVKHGARLSAIQGPNGLITDEQIDRCRSLAIERLRSTGLRTKGDAGEQNLFQQTQLHAGQ